MNRISVVMPATTRSGLSRMLKYVLVRATTLLLTVVAAVYLTILIANFGGQINAFIRADIDFAVGLSMRDMRGITTEERATIAEGLTRNIYAEKHHLILQPLGLLMLLSFAFVMLGISLERRTKTRLGFR